MLCLMSHQVLCMLGFMFVRSYGLGLMRLGLMKQHQLKDSITMCKDSLQELVKWK